MALSVTEYLQGLNAYPIPTSTLTGICDRREVDKDILVEGDVKSGSGFRLACADVFRWLSFAPNISQGGISYSFNDEQRKALRREADAIYDAYGADDGARTLYGYKGRRI